MTTCYLEKTCYSEVLERIKESEVVGLTQNLLKIDSVVRPEKGIYEEEVSQYITEYLKKLDFKVEIYEVEPKRPNVIAVLEGSEEGKCLLFEGHTDVVTEGVASKWTYPPFAAEIHDGRIYGRGACDTKGNVAAMIMAAKAIKQSGVKFKGKIVLCIPCDEEGMMIGIKDFIKKGYADKVDAAIICEPEENNICIKQKGAMRVLVKMYGKQAHGCMPLTGINPVPRMAKFVQEIEELNSEFMAVYGKDEFLGYPSVTPTIVLAPSETEAQLNVVPGELMMTLDIRTIPGIEHDYIEHRLRGIIKRLERDDPDFKATLEVFEQRPWTETPMNHPITKSVTKAYKDIAEKEPIYNGVPGATDGTFLKAWKGIEIITTGAGNRLIPHQYDEYVDIDELVESTKLFALSALYYLNGDYE
jgi:succinyl-diaminopimelate desuccinylase